VSDDILVVDAGKVLTPLEEFSPGRVVLKGDRIEAAGTANDLQIPLKARRIVEPDLWLVPGFIDPHIHGSAGADVMAGTWDAINIISRKLATHGTTSFLPTTISSPAAELTTAIDRIGTVLAGGNFGGAQPLGIHLEGPFISPARLGTHNPAHVQLPDAGLLSRWISGSRGTLRLLTMAPELDGATALAEFAEKSGIVLGMGHTNASSEQAAAAAEGGMRYAVHTFNAMRQFAHRDPGVVGTVLADDRIFAEIIADGIHVHPDAIRIFARAKGLERVILVTDAVSATGMPDGPYSLGSQLVYMRAGVCRDDEGRLAGSTLTQDVALRNFIQWTGRTLKDVLPGLTFNPATALRLEGRGRIETGCIADLTMIDSDLRIMKTFVAGKLVFERQGG
jgi:N-acetylglucosamine-6-phosphate deacetylase